MIDSTNPRQLADNIRKLWDKFKSISGDLLPSRSTATTGQILKLTGETKTPSWADEYSYTPPAYSETETATGQKWIDGKDVYKKIITGTFSESPASSYSIGTFTEIESILYSNMVFSTEGAIYGKVTNGLLLNTSTGNMVITNVQSSSAGYNYYVEIDYTKKTPGRAPEDSDHEPEEVKEPEVKETKTTRKKTK